MAQQAELELKTLLSICLSDQRARKLPHASELESWSRVTLSEVVETTPYETFLRESLEKEKKQLELLTAQIQRSGSLRKRMLKGHLDEINQNVQILSSDLEKYGHGLSWLREPTKERDEKAEHLGPVDVSAIIGQVKPAAPPVAARPPPAVGASPTVGTPRPTSVAVGKPVAQVGTARPSVPVGQPRPSVPVGQPRPSVPIGQPKPSTPISQVGTPPASQVSTPAPNEPKSAETPKPSEAEVPKSPEPATQAEPPKPSVPKQETKKSEESESESAESSPPAESSSS